MSEDQIVVGDHSAQTEGSWLKELESLSGKRGDQGAFHSGCILWIQSYLDDKFGFVLKAGIAPVLNAVPSIFPKDLPQQLEQKETIDLTEEQKDFFRTLNTDLIIPLQGIDLVRIILAGQAYEEV